MLATRTTAARRDGAKAQTPFKGDAFPDYVLHRTRQPSTGLPAVEPTAVPSTVQQREPPMIVVATTPAPASSPLTSTCSGSRAPRSTPKTRASPQRPSLADQLKAISQGAQDITSRLKSTYKLAPDASPSLPCHQLALSSPVGFQATTISMTVGRLDCRFPCPATFALDHCTYLFQHPFEAKEIQMIMYYRDMTDVSVAPRDKSFRFRIHHELHQFGADYNPANPQHCIKIVFATTSEADRVKQFLADRRQMFPSLATTASKPKR